MRRLPKPIERTSSRPSQHVSSRRLRTWPLPQPDGKLGKEERGKLLVVGGSLEIPGGILLAALAGMRSGAGTLQIATAAKVAAAVAVAVPEARVIGLRADAKGHLSSTSCRAIFRQSLDVQALVMGPGSTDASALAPLARHCLGGTGDGHPTLVVDAGAIEAFASKGRIHMRGKTRVVITPHAGEMASLWGIERDHVLARPRETAIETARALDCVVVLKGPETWIATPAGTSYHDDAGNPGLGTSGSGDVLSGIIGGLAARGASPIQAAVWGVHLHKLAGHALAKRIGPIGYLARELVHELPRLLGTMGRGASRGAAA